MFIKYSKYIGWLLIAALFAPSWCLAASAGKLVAEGNTAYDKGQYDEALGKYDEAGQKNPESAASVSVAATREVF